MKDKFTESAQALGCVLISATVLIAIAVLFAVVRRLFFS